MRKPDRLTIREPLELVKIGLPVLAEAVAVSLFIGFCMVLVIIRATEIPAVLQ